MASLVQSLSDQDNTDLVIVDDQGESFELQLQKVKEMVNDLKKKSNHFDSRLPSGNFFFDRDGKCQTIENHNFGPTFIIHEAPNPKLSGNPFFEYFIFAILSLLLALLVCGLFYLIYLIFKHLQNAKAKESQHQTYHNPQHHRDPPAPQQVDQRSYLTMNYISPNIYVNLGNPQAQQPAGTGERIRNLSEDILEAQRLSRLLPQDRNHRRRSFSHQSHSTDSPVDRRAQEDSRVSGQVRRASDERLERPHPLLSVTAKTDGAKPGPEPDNRLQAERPPQGLDRVEATQSRVVKEVGLEKMNSANPKIGTAKEEPGQDAMNLQRIQQLIKADTKLKKNKPLFTDCHQPTPEQESKLNSLQPAVKEEPPLEDGKFKKSFQEAQFIGEGSYGAVYRAIHKLDKKAYAVKKISIRQQDLNDWTASKVFREVMAMANTHHENIVRFITCWLENGEDQSAEDLEKSYASDSKFLSSKRSKSMDGLSVEMSGISAFQAQEASALSRNKSNLPEKSCDGLDIHFAEDPSSRSQNKGFRSRRKASHNPIKFIDLYIQVAALHRDGVLRHEVARHAAAEDLAQPHEGEHLQHLLADPQRRRVHPRNWHHTPRPEVAPLNAGRATSTWTTRTRSRSETSASRCCSRPRITSTSRCRTAGTSTKALSAFRRTR